MAPVQLQGEGGAAFGEPSVNLFLGLFSLHAEDAASRQAEGGGKGQKGCQVGDGTAGHGGKETDIPALAGIVRRQVQGVDRGAGETQLADDMTQKGGALLTRLDQRNRAIGGRSLQGQTGKTCAAANVEQRGGRAEGVEQGQQGEGIEEMQFDKVPERGGGNQINGFVPLDQFPAVCKQAVYGLRIERNPQALHTIRQVVTE